jgi:hypothetical protein
VVLWGVVSKIPPSDVATLKSDQSYTGYYSAPWREVCTLFKSLADGKR